jgi:hypothetical protein
MSKLKKLLYSKTGRIIISIVLGLGLASIFRFSCKNNNCLIFKAPSIEKIRSKVFKFDNKCYKFNEIAGKCNNDKKILNFA